MEKQFIILNFSHGNGPQLRTTEVALALNDEREKRGASRMGIIVPWVYQERQKTIFKENFKTFLKWHPDEIIFVRDFENILAKPLFYERDSYVAWLKRFVDTQRGVEENVKTFVRGPMRGETIDGRTVEVPAGAIALCISRYPIVDFGITPSYHVSFAYNSEILKKALQAGIAHLPPEIAQKAIGMYETIEEKQALHCIAEPATFLREKDTPLYESEVLTPPNARQYTNSKTLWPMRKGIYVSMTGIPGMKHLFEELSHSAYRTYTHKTGWLPGSIKASPSILANKNILLHFARVGWGSAWLSFYTETPLVMMPYQESDDLEVYFNNQSLERAGLGREYRGESIEELLEWGNEYKKAVREKKNELIEKYGTLDGVWYTARAIDERYRQSIDER